MKREQAKMQTVIRKPKPKTEPPQKRHKSKTVRYNWPPHVGPLKLGMNICMRDRETGQTYLPTIYGSSSILQLKPLHEYDLVICPQPLDRVTTNVLYDSLRVVCFSNLGASDMICIPSKPAEHTLSRFVTLLSGPLSLTIMVWPCFGHESVSTEVTFRIFLQAEMGQQQEGRIYRDATPRGLTESNDLFDIYHPNRTPTPIPT